MTPLTFGNPLKFGPDSCPKTKGRPTFLHRERESTQSSAQTHTTIFIEKGPSTRAHDDGGGFSAQFRSKPGVDNMHPAYSHLFNYPKAN